MNRSVKIYRKDNMIKVNQTMRHIEILVETSYKTLELQQRKNIARALVR